MARQYNTRTSHKLTELELELESSRGTAKCNIRVVLQLVLVLGLVSELVMLGPEMI